MQATRFKRSILAMVIAGISCQAIAAPQDQGNQSGQQRNADDPCAKNTSQVAGAVVGALLGAYLGNKVGKGNGRTLATAAGALGGLALGNYVGSELDRRKCEVSRIARKNNLEILITDVAAQPEQDGNGGPRQAGAERVGMSISIEDRPSAGVSEIAGGDAIGNAASSTQFQSGSDVLTPQAEGYFREIAAQYALAFRPDALPQGASQEQFNAVQGLRQKRLLVLGHTDDTGNSRLNADLSEHRARNVASLFADAGMPMSQIFYQGSGETQPLADNRTDAGRARNRRVEIVDLTDEMAFQKYLAGRSTNANFYRVAASPAAAPEASAGDAQANSPNPAKRETRVRIAEADKASARPTPKVAAAQSAAPAAATAASAYDFGGQPVGARAAAIDIGKLITPKSSFNLISPAIADDLPMARSCGDDRPRVANSVKALQGNQEYHVSEYLPNLYGTSWSDRVNGNLVALTNVAVLRDGAAPARKPTVLVYKATPGKSFSNAKPDFSAVADVNTYQGEAGLLYRVFINGPIKCIDVVIPRERNAQVANSNLYYQAGTTRMIAAFNPKIAK